MWISRALTRVLPAVLLAATCLGLIKQVKQEQALAPPNVVGLHITSGRTDIGSRHPISCGGSR